MDIDPVEAVTTKWFPHERVTAAAETDATRAAATTDGDA
jgi:hypothetical protein